MSNSQELIKDLKRQIDTKNKEIKSLKEEIETLKKDNDRIWDMVPKFE